jgi:hypothetical protein
VLQKTLDLLGQLRAAVERRTPLGRQSGAENRRQNRELLAKLDEADALLRRGVVEASYRWAIAGPPEAGQEQAAEDLDWSVPFVPELSPRRAAPSKQPGSQHRARRNKTRRKEQPKAVETSGQGQPQTPPGRRKPPRSARTGGPPRGRKGNRRR